MENNTIMKLRLVLLLIMAFVISCSKEEDSGIEFLNDASVQKFVGKVIADSDGYWLITKTIQNSDCLHCSNISMIDGITFFNSDRNYSKDAIGYISDSELYNNGLLALTSNKILHFAKNLQSSVFRTASTGELFKLMARDATGKIWVLSNQAIFSFEGESIPFPNTIAAIDFEISDNKTFWIASSDTVYRFNNTLSSRLGVSEISTSKAFPAAIYSMAVDKNGNVWMNTSEKLLRLENGIWRETQAGTFESDNFKTIPFMDVDSRGNLWLAEKHYQAFTTLHCFNGTVWSSYKLQPPLEKWITDIENAGQDIWIATVNGLQKMVLK